MNTNLCQTFQICFRKKKLETFSIKVLIKDYFVLIYHTKSWPIRLFLVNVTQCKKKKVKGYDSKALLAHKNEEACVITAACL